MKQYYYSDGTKKVGPFSLEELEAGRWTKLSIFLGLAVYVISLILVGTGVTLSIFG